MKIPPVRHHRQSIRYEESEENEMENDPRNIVHYTYSPSKIM